MRLLILSIAFTTLAACGGTPGAQPHDMSAASHEAAATEHERTAQAHAAQYDPNASTERSDCLPRGGAHEEGAACWSSVRNPTAAHSEEADKHHKMAVDHRAASQALRDAEAKMCVGISEADREMSPFEHREDIASVEPLNVNVSSAKTGGNARTVGATVTFRAVPGMTAQWLQRVVDCHLARNAVLGHVVPEMPSCPLVPNGVTATVTPTSDGFAVALRSDDTKTAQEILRRAQSLSH